MIRNKKTNELVSAYSVVIPDDYLVAFVRRSYMMNLSKTAFFLAVHTPQGATTTKQIDLETDERWTYGMFEDRRLEMCERLKRVGVGNEHKILIVMENCLEYMVAVMAVQSLGACAVLVNQQSSLRDLIHYQKLTSCSVILTSQTRANTIKNLVEAQPTGVEHVLVLMHHSYRCLLHDYCSSNNSPVNIEQATLLPPNQLPAFILFTSGTTGFSKGAVMSHRNHVSGLCQYCHPRFGSFEDSNYSLLYQPLSHGYGVFRMLYGLYTCTTTLLLKKFKLENFCVAIHKYKLRSLNLVPPIAVMLTNSELPHKFDLSSLRYIYSSAAPMGPVLEERLKQTLKGVKIIQAFALTECSGMGTHLPTDQLSDSPQGTVGFLYPNTTCKIIHPETKERRGPNEEGEILLKGPQNMLGYLHNQLETADCIDNEGFVHTGDCGYYDDRGFFFITDRLKEMIKYNGLQVAPAELESLLLSHADVTDAAVVGVASELHGQVPHAWVVRRQGSECTEAEVIKWFAEQVAPYKQLKGGVKFVQAIPKSASGKILRKVVRAQLKQSKL